MHFKSLWIKASAKCINVNVISLAHTMKGCGAVVKLEWCLARISFPDPIYLSFLQIFISFLYCPYK